MLRSAKVQLLAVLCAALAGCGPDAPDDSIDIAFIGTPDGLAETGLRLSPAAQHIRAATAEGLVAFDANGEVVPALAERWIVTDDGSSYIFRLRDSAWPDGDPLTGESVRDALRRNIAGLAGTSLGLDLAPISEVRAMTGRVVEIRLQSPMPDFLQLLAQPELGLTVGGDGAGPMTARWDDGVANLAALPPGARGLPDDPTWAESMRTVHVRAMPAAAAVAAFRDQQVAVVLGGRLASLPLADTGPLSRGTVRLDGALGLFGLRVNRAEGLLAEPARREALAMALDRTALLEPFNIGGWVPTTRLVAPDLPGDPGTIGERWADGTIEQRRALAQRRLAGWQPAEGGTRSVTVDVGEGPGADLLFRGIRRDFAAVGVEAVRSDGGSRADLQLIDRTARYGAARWFLNQFNCALSDAPCSEEADARVAEALASPDALERSALLAEAEADLTAANVYIPIGAPVRWSLVRGDIAGFVENRWNFHPLFPLSQRPI